MVVLCLGGSCVSNPPSDVEIDPYPLMAKWRQSERAQMIEAVRDMIQEARRMATSKRTPARERIRWTRLAGQLIWYKDSILRSMSLESMERELTKLKDEVFVRRRLPDAPPGYERNNSEKVIHSVEMNGGLVRSIGRIIFADLAEADDRRPLRISSLTVPREIGNSMLDQARQG